MGSQKRLNQVKMDKRKRLIRVISRYRHSRPSPTQTKGHSDYNVSDRMPRVVQTSFSDWRATRGAGGTCHKA